MMTPVRVGAEIWLAPRWFGAAYRRVLAAPRPDLLPGLLLLLGYRVSLRTVHTWPLRRRVEAEVWASNMLARQNTQTIRMHPHPAWLPAPWVDGHSQTLTDLDYAPGRLVRMSAALKAALVANDCAAHVAEFGECIGAIEGLVCYGPGEYGPELDVRWRLSGLRYCYAPGSLDLVGADP